MNNVYIDSNGCAILRHETYRISKYFALNHWNEVTSVEEADIVVVTCCGVTDSDEENAITMMKDLWNKTPKNGRFIVSGCLPKISRERILSTIPSAILIANDQLSRFDEIVRGMIKINDVFFNVGAGRKYYFDNETFEKDDDLSFALNMKERYNSEELVNQYNYSTPRHYIWKETDIFQVRVSYGCGGNCSFCATKLGIGSFKSIPLNTIIKQIQDGQKKGYTKFMLVGDEIGFYGTDIGLSLPHLIKSIYDVNNNFRIGIRYIYPDMLVKYYPDLKTYFKSGFIYYFCSAIQTGSSRLLKLMNRNPNITPFIECMKDINKGNYPVFKHSQIIVGFPTENDEDIVDTINCLMTCKFDYLNINPFSMRKGTKVYNMSLEEVEPFVVEERCHLLNNYLKSNRKALMYEKAKQIILDA